MKKDILKLENLKKEVIDYSYSYNDIVEELQEIANKYELEYILEDIISTEQLEYMAQKELEKYGIERLYFFLPDSSKGNPYLNNNYFYLNGYDNAENITSEYLTCIIDDMIDAIEEI